ncbi:hypothetical protein PMZ80_000233 [Knufia obscura]|uniref:PH domain-containing protein n=1 Tax=Knufia obscura TaxID=1635080 RepID=A0ABR0RZS0_9EURO|nr:hypothetical protein PMZ80_000233 [Knufia obscura]
MGRLRNLSASFKAAAFPSASSASPNRSSTVSPDASDSTPEKKENSTTVREASTTSLPDTSTARPSSMIYTPPTIGPAANEEIEELKPVFSYLSSHGNKLYQEGYFLKLDDLDTNGKPNPNRVWTECFAQLVGTVLSFWDAEALDAAGQDGEVAPSFINLADASIKMIETLPTRNQEVQPLQNVLSISTAGKNRYLLHFNSLHSLTQWTAGIRLAMFENASLQELYTGCVIAGKGRHLNSINQIMTKNKFRIEDWARVRFGAGTPWRRCWCVIEPPDEKEWQKSQKRLGKRSAYEKTTFPKGDIKFYDTKKIKKALPIATITDAYSAYAIYPQSKPLINESTLVKLEGKITIHSQPESKTEGFVFVMPEVHPAVSGFEMMLRWLLPVYDTFSLYGRPNRLVPDTQDTKSLMFAMPKERRYGYLDIIDIAALIHTEGSDKWSEREWRKQMKDAVARRMSMQTQGRSSNLERVRNTTNPHPAIQFSDDASTHSTQSSHRHNMSTDNVFEPPKKTHTAPAHIAGSHYHARSASENINLSPRKLREPAMREYKPTRLSEERTADDNFYPPEQGQLMVPHEPRKPLRPRVNDAGYARSANSSDSETQGHINPEDVEHDMIEQKPVQPVVPPPEFQHHPNEQPKRRPADRPEMRREKSRMSDATLSQMNPRVLEELRREDAARGSGMQGMQGGAAASAAAYAWGQKRQDGSQSQNMSQTQTQNRGVGETETPADTNGTLTNAYRPAVVTNPSSTSQTTLSSVKRKPLPTTDLDATNLDTNIASRPPLDRNYSSTSNYSMPNHDRDSSPDYASRASEEQPRGKEKERIRGGTRKVVGDSDARTPPDADNLHINFGQTLRLTPDSSRPGTAAGRRSPFDSLGRPDSASGRRSPFDSLGLPSTGRKSPLNPFGSSSPARTPEKQSPTPPRPSHSRSQSYAWQPGTQLRDGSDGLTPEEFVHQRAAMAMKPHGYVPHRTMSSGRIEQIKSDQPSRPESPTSPTRRKLQKRSPSSRNSLASIDYSSHLSAREQEHVARMTGGPLLSGVNPGTKTPDPSVGLIGAIGAREQEKKDIKEGLQGRMVQAAIDQRQREARSQAQAEQRRQSQYMVQQQQNPYAYPVASDYASRNVPSAHQAYWNSTQQPQPQMQPQAYNQSVYQQQAQQAPQSVYGMPQGAQSTYDPQQRQSMYGVQQQQQSQQPVLNRTISQMQQGYPAQSLPTQQRPQSQYSQYGGFYTPHGR